MAEAAHGLVMPMTLVPVLADIVSETVATTPLEMSPVFIPVATQLYVPVEPEHVSDLPAAVNDAPAATETLTTLVG